MEHDTDEQVLEAKQRLTPKMPRGRGRYRCPMCGRAEPADGNCPDDGTPLRRMPSSAR